MIDIGIWFCVSLSLLSFLKQTGFSKKVHERQWGIVHYRGRENLCQCPICITPSSWQSEGRGNGWMYSVAAHLFPVKHWSIHPDASSDKELVKRSSTYVPWNSHCSSSWGKKALFWSGLVWDAGETGTKWLQQTASRLGSSAVDCPPSFSTPFPICKS